MNQHSRWKLLLVVAVLAWSFYEMYPPVGRDLVKQFKARAVGRDAAFVGMVDRDGFWFYSLNYPGVEHTDLKLAGVTPRTPPGDPRVAARVERILAAYVAANMLIESNRLWSWKEFGGRL